LDSGFRIQRSAIVVSTPRGESSFFGLRSKVFLQDSGFRIQRSAIVVSTLREEFPSSV
jgi:hypothetical protein